jgi:AraC-like DNA-binding protein
VQLTRARPADVGAFRRVLDARMRFGAERNAIVFPATWLEHRLQRADPGLHRILEEKLDSLDAVHGTDFVARVRGVVRAQLLATDAGAAAVAERLALSRRTLHRRLEAGGTTYERLLDETRFAIARQLLAKSKSPLLEVGVALGYANPGAFTRAFRRWTGMTPSAWRLKVASGSAARRTSPRPSARKSGAQSAGSSRRIAPRSSSVSR